MKPGIIFFEKLLSEEIGSGFKIIHMKPLSGGCINQAVKLETNQGTFFVKWNTAEKTDLFEKESRGLSLLRNTGEINIPKEVCLGTFQNLSYLILEYVETGSPNFSYWKDFGASLANLHKHSASCFGLDHDNYIGSLVQKNKQEKNWVSFFFNHRLQFQLDLAIRSGYDSIAGDFEKLFLKLSDILPEDKPALLHGDLWSGNVLTNKSGNVSLIDPAVYYGNREAELAFTRLFGGFDEDFYESYTQTFPLEKGFDTRVDIYNLYPLLVHLNLFGAAYENSVKSILKRYA